MTTVSSCFLTALFSIFCIVAEGRHNGGSSSRPNILTNCTEAYIPTLNLNRMVQCDLSQVLTGYAVAQEGTDRATLQICYDHNIDCDLALLVDACNFIKPVAIGPNLVHACDLFPAHDVQMEFLQVLKDVYDIHDGEDEEEEHGHGGNEYSTFNEEPIVNHLNLVFQNYYSNRYLALYTAPLRVTHAEHMSDATCFEMSEYEDGTRNLTHCSTGYQIYQDQRSRQLKIAPGTDNSIHKEWLWLSASCDGPDPCFLLQNTHSEDRVYSSPDGRFNTYGGAIYDDQKWKLQVQYFPGGLSVAANNNNDCASAQTIQIPTTGLRATTNGATATTNVLGMGYDTIGPTVWYKFVGTGQTLSLTFDCSNWDGSRWNAVVRVMGMDNCQYAGGYFGRGDLCVDGVSFPDINTQAGQHYAVVVEGYTCQGDCQGREGFANSGDFTLSLQPV